MLTHLIKKLGANDVFVSPVGKEFIVVCTFNNCHLNPDYNDSPRYAEYLDAEREAENHRAMEDEYYTEKGE